MAERQHDDGDHDPKMPAPVNGGAPWALLAQDQAQEDLGHDGQQGAVSQVHAACGHQRRSAAAQGRRGVQQHQRGDDVAQPVMGPQALPEGPTVGGGATVATQQERQRDGHGEQQHQHPPARAGQDLQDGSVSFPAYVTSYLHLRWLTMVARLVALPGDRDDYDRFSSLPGQLAYDKVGRSERVVGDRP